MQNIKNHNRAATIRFIAWIMLVSIVAFLFVRIFYLGFSLNTNVLNLLPKSQQNPVVAKASDQFSRTMGNQIVFLIGNKSKTEAQKSADLFFSQIKSSPLFQSLNFLINTNEQLAWGQFYFPHRLSLLTPLQKKLLQENNANQLEASALFSLYSPIGLTNSNLLKSDPFFLFQKFILSMPKPASNIILVNQRMMAQADNQWYVMGTAQIKKDSFSLSNQNKVLKFIQNSKAEMLKLYPTSTLLMNGMLFYAKAGADEAQRNISTIGIGSLIGIILLVLLTFRSLSPLFLTLISCLVGFIAAFVVTKVVFGTIYLFTLIFGASLIGIVVDYAFFYYADQLVGGQSWDPLQGLKNIFPGISLGLVNIVLAYLVLSLTPFPGLRQLAVFSITGLVIAYLTVVCAFPTLIKAKSYSFTPPLLTLVNVYLNIWLKLSTKTFVVLFTLIFAFSLLGIYQLKPNDDVRILQSVPDNLKNNENKVKQIIGSHIGLNFFLVEGDSPNQVLFNESLLTNEINKKFPSVNNQYIAMNAYIPNLSDQKENFYLVKSELINTRLSRYLKRVGVKREQALQIKQSLSRLKFDPITIQDWLNSTVSGSLRFLWLGKIDHHTVTVVLLSSQLNTQALEKISAKFSFATYINNAEMISHTFKLYRKRVSRLLLLAYLALLILLTLRYSLRKAIIYFLPPTAASALSLAGLGWLGIPFTLFNLLGVILILGLGVDYVLFFAETKSSYKVTMLAVSLSAIISILSFGLLALSATPVIHYFGITVLIGISSALLLAPLAARNPTFHNRIKS